METNHTAASCMYYDCRQPGADAVFNPIFGRGGRLSSGRTHYIRSKYTVRDNLLSQRKHRLKKSKTAKARESGIESTRTHIQHTLLKKVEKALQQMFVITTDSYSKGEFPCLR